MASSRLIRAKEKEKDETDRILIEELRARLEEIDRRIEALDAEILHLQEQLKEIEERRQEAFERMHALEEILEEVERSGLDDDTRSQLKRVLGDEANHIEDDVALLELARTRIEEEHRIGLEADEEAEAVRQTIVVRTELRDELTQEREDIQHDTDGSLEDRMARADAALERSFEADLTGAEAGRTFQNTQLNARTKALLIDQRVEVDKSETFDLDKDMTLDDPAPPTPGMH